MGAAVAHQLHEPLTALMLYLHEIDHCSAAASGAAESPASVRQTVGMAMKEAERACDILEKVCQGGKDDIDIHSVIVRGRDTIDVLARGGVQNTANASQPTLTLFSDRHLLTAREREVLAEIAGGATNKQGSHRLGISTRTFEVHRSHIMQKTGTKNAADLVRSLLTAS